MKKLLAIALAILSISVKAQNQVETGSVLQTSTKIYLKNPTDTVNRRSYILYPSGDADRMVRFPELLRGLNGKQNTITLGTTGQYFRGDLSLATFPSLTGFVPYTGATAAVNLGNFGISSSLGASFTSNNGLSGSSKRTASLGYDVGGGTPSVDLYVGTAYASYRYDRMLFYDGTYQLALFKPSLTATRNVFFQDKDGTVALLGDLTSGYVPYTGATGDIVTTHNITASSFITSPIGGNSISIQGQDINGTSSIHLNPAVSQAVEVNGAFKLNSNLKSLTLSTNLDNNYTQSFQNKNGVIALTSDLAAYMTLAAPNQTVTQKPLFSNGLGTSSGSNTNIDGQLFVNNYAFFSGTGNLDINKDTFISSAATLNFANTDLSTPPTDGNTFKYNTGGGVVLHTQTSGSNYATTFKDNQITDNSGVRYAKKTDISTDSTYNASTYVKKNSPQIVLNYPSGFKFRPFNVTEKNRKYYTSIQITDLIKSKIKYMKPYFTNYITGSNSNDGLTPATAVKTIAYAYATLSARLIYDLTNGVELNDTWGSLNPSLTNTDDLIIIGLGNSKTFITTAPSTAPTWSVVTGTTYSATQANAANVVDMAYVDSLGYPLRLKVQSSLANCEATPGSFYITGTTVNINLTNGRVPDANVLVLQTTANATYSANAGTIYVEGITFMGGGTTTGTHGVISTASVGSTLSNLNKDCKFLYGQASVYNNNGGEGSRNLNNKYNWFENCIAYGNARDGINYLSDSTNYMTFIETNCEASYNGTLVTSASVNASSAHNLAYGIRINGKGHHNSGPNYADVDGCKSWNIGMKAFSSIANSGNPHDNSNFTSTSAVTGPKSQFYLTDVQSSGSIYDFLTTTAIPSDVYVDSLSVGSGLTLGVITYTPYPTSNEAAIGMPEAASTYTATGTPITSITTVAPTGLTINTPLTGSTPTMTVAYQSGYAIPTTAKQTNWDTAFGWGNYALNGWGTGVQNNSALTGDVQSFTTSAVTRVSSTATNIPVAQNGYLVQLYRSSTSAKLIFYADNGATYENVKVTTWGGWNQLAFLVSGVLPVANGGTGVATISAGSLIIGNGTSTISTVAAVATGSILISNGTGVAPVYSTALPSGITATTQVSTDNSTKVATTAMVQSAIAQYGAITLVAGVGTATVTGVSTSSKATTGFVSIGGTVTTTWQYKIACTANTVTITAITNAGTTNTSDTSTLNYAVKL